MIDLCEDVRFEAYIPGATKFILDVSKLDEDKLGNTQHNENYEWVDFTRNALEFSIDRGADLYNNNGFARADASTLTVLSYEDDYDPEDRGAIFPGMPVRVTVKTEGFVEETPGIIELKEVWEPVYAGKMDSLSIEYTNSGKPISTLQASDDVERLANVTTFFGESQTVKERLEDIAAQTDTTINVKGGDGATLAPKESLTNAWDIAELAITSEGGFIFPKKDNTLEAWMREYRNNNVSINFSDIHDDDDPKHSCYSGLRVENTSERVVNTVLVTNISESDLNLNDIEEDLPPVKDQASVDIYGPKELQLKTNLVSLDDANDLSQFVLGAFATPKDSVEYIEFTPETTGFTLIDVGDNVEIVFSDVVDDTFLVSKVSHEVSPDGWNTTLGLFKRGDGTRWL